MLANIYLPFLYLHNYLRWAAILLLAYALGRAVLGWLQKKKWTEADRKAALAATISLDLQLTIGLLLYALGGFAASGRFLGEHIIAMVVAVVFGHLGSALPKRVEQDLRKHRRAGLWFGLTALVVLFSIPWSQPLFRGLGF